MISFYDLFRFCRSKPSERFVEPAVAVVLQSVAFAELGIAGTAVAVAELEIAGTAVSEWAVAG